MLPIFQPNQFIVSLIKNRNFILILSLFIINSLGAQELHFNKLTVNDGLTQHDVSCITQDSFGFIWIGTYDGLNRYDGFQVKSYRSSSKNKNSLSSNRVRCLFEDSKKRLWIGSDGNGLTYYSLEKERFFRVSTPEGFEMIKDICESTNGTILIATSNGILRVIDEPIPRVELLQTALTGINITKLNSTGTGEVYASTSNGIWVINGSEASQIKNIRPNYYNAITTDLQNNVWVGGRNKLIKISKNKGTVEISKKEITDFDIRSLSVSKNGEIWVGSSNNGILIINPGSMEIIKRTTFEEFNNRGLLSNTVLSLYCDASNTMWVANRKGVCYANLEQKKFQRIDLEASPIKFKNKHIRTIYKKENQLYFGVQNIGFFRYSFLNKQLEKLNLDYEINPNKISELNGVLHFSSSKGIYTLKKDGITLKEKNLNNLTHNLNISSMCDDPYGNEYYGFFGGLIIKKKNTTNFAHTLNRKLAVLRGKRVWNTIFDKVSNCIWVGTISSGIFKLNLNSNGDFISVEMYNDSMTGTYFIPNNSIWGFFMDKNNDFFVGTDAGLFLKKFNSDSFEKIDIEGISDKKIMGIQKDHSGKIWMNNSQGLICYNPSNNTLFNYTYFDGLESSTLTEAITTSGNTIFVGTNSGINYFNPDEITTNPYPANVSFTQFKIHNEDILPNKEYFGDKVLTQSINTTKEIVLSHKQNNFLLEFTGTNYANSNGNMYRYKLKGYQDNWTETNSKYRFAKYTNLASKKYIFEVEAANHDGVWSGTTKSLHIRVKPAPWLTIWAYLIYFILAIGFIGIFIYFLNNKQKLNHQIELDQILLKQEQEINEFKLRFFTDVAHEFKTPLSLIIGPLSELMHSNLSKERIQFSFQVVARNTQRMMFLVHQLLDFRKMNANINILNVNYTDLTQFIKHSTQAFYWQADNDEIEFNTIHPDEFVCCFDKDILEKVMYNLLSNAFKYTPKKGKIELELKKTWKSGEVYAQIIIKDSGIGISDEEKKEIFKRFFHGENRSSSGIGLHLSDNLIKAHKGIIDVSDSIFGGAEFTISIPVNNNSYSKDEMSSNSTEINYGLDNFKFKKNTESEKTEAKESILIVEDDHDLRQYLKNFLQDKFKIFEAVNGKEGLLLARKILPDLIVSDVMMPELDGISMCKILKEDHKTSHIPTLILTAKTDEDSKNSGFEVGAWDYISKPFNTNDLSKKIENIINTRNNFKSYILNQNILPEIKKHYTPFDQQLISKIKKIILENITDSTFTVEVLSKEIGLSRMQLHRKLKTLTGQSSTNFINTIKIAYAANLFESGTDRVQEVMDAVGVSSYSHFNTLFKKQHGVTPSEYLKKITLIQKK